jgi:hypothetical protein
MSKVQSFLFTFVSACWRFRLAQKSRARLLCHAKVLPAQANQEGMRRSSIRLSIGVEK